MKESQKLKVKSKKIDIQTQISNSLKQAIKEIVGKDSDPLVEIPTDLSKGDFTTNVAMTIFAKLKTRNEKLKSPLGLAEEIATLLNTKYNLQDTFRLIEAKQPGFINFWLSEHQLDAQVDSLMHMKETESNGKKIVFEFGDPNPFKELHIGHLRGLILGESLSRLFESQGYAVVRANYQGDVGPHVAKAMFGIKNHELGIMGLEQGSLRDKAKFLGGAYKLGAEKYETDKSIKEEIDALNIKIYSAVANAKADRHNDTDIYSVWQKGRKISLNHFENLYKLLGVKYEKYYFESQTAVLGKEIVEKNTPKVFEENDGAIIYRGERDGLHTRVFITSNDNPTYEAKDLALSVIKNIDYPSVGKSIIMTANEQIDYFKVVLSALDKVFKELAKITSHMSYGFINLKVPPAQRASGSVSKMSSRKGNVVGAFWLIEEVEKRLKERHKSEEKEVLNSTTVGSVKWSMLKFSRESDISFSIDESIDLEGNSGPYIQYSYARIQSILAKKAVKNHTATPLNNLEPEELALARKLCQFETVIKTASDELSPNILCNYLFELAKVFNSFYESKKIIGDKRESEKLKIVGATGEVLKNGLYLLGIDAPTRI